MEGSIWSAVGPGVGNSSCTSCSQDVEILKANGSHLYIGGEFATVGGNTNLKKLVKWDGSSYSAVGNGTLTARNIYAIEFENDTIYVGSDELLSYDNINMRGISKFNGTSWSGLGSGICLVNGNTVNSILIYENKLHCGGNFYQAGNKVASNFATYTFPQSLSTYYQDNDNDGYGNPNVTT